MLSLVPGILFLAPLSATILRFGAGLCFMYAGYAFISERREVERVHVPLVGHPSAWMVWTSGIFSILVGVALFIGLFTQAAAICGMIVAIKHFSLSKKYEALRPLSRGAYALLFLMCVCLLITGAGPYGFDLPL